MNNDDYRTLLMGLGTLVIGMAVKKGLSYGWKHFAGEDPPDAPEQDQFRTGEVLAWTVSTAVVSGLMKGVYSRLLQKKIR